MANLTIEDIAQEVYAICRERNLTTKECVEQIARNIIGNEDSILDDKFKSIIKKYRESYKGLQEVAEYVKQKCYE